MCEYACNVRCSALHYIRDRPRSTEIKMILCVIAIETQSLPIIIAKMINKWMNALNDDRNEKNVFVDRFVMAREMPW